MAERESIGIRVCLQLDGKGGAQPLRLSDPEPQTGWSWIHLDYSNTTAQQWLQESAGLDPTVVQALTTVDSRPRVAIHETSFLLVFRGINHNPGAEPEDMVSVRLWVEKGRIISTQKRDMRSLTAIIERLTLGHGPTTPGAFVVDLAQQIEENIFPVIGEEDELLDDLEEEALTSGGRKLRNRLAEVQQELLAIRRYLAPQREALADLQKLPGEIFTRSQHRHLAEVQNRLIRDIENLDALRDRAHLVQEQIFAHLSESLSSRMYLLAVLTTLFLPLTFLTGLLGTNVGGIPGGHSAHGFWYVSGLCAVLLVAEIFYFRRWRP